jgi:hypothetical protein
LLANLPVRLACFANDSKDLAGLPVSASPFPFPHACARDHANMFRFTGKSARHPKNAIVTDD